MPPSFVTVNGNLGRQLNAQDLADLAPTDAMLADHAAGCQDLKTAVARWRAIREGGLAGLDALLAKHGLAALPAAGPALVVPACAVGANRTRRPRR